METENRVTLMVLVNIMCKKKPSFQLMLINWISVIRTTWNQMVFYLFIFKIELKISYMQHPEANGVFF